MSDAAQAPDPFSMWRDWLSQSERQWNGFMNDAMATDQFSQAMGRFMDVYLNGQKSMNDVMGRYFAAMNMPTRTDIMSLGNRLAEIEDRLGTIENAIDGLSRPAPAARSSAVPAAADAPARPPRTKQPPKP